MSFRVLGRLQRFCYPEGGICSKHFKKAQRVVKIRKISVVGEGGEVSWVRSKFIALVCLAAQRTEDMSDVSTKMSSDVCGGIPNKKQGNNFEFVSDQSTPEDKPDGKNTT